MTNLYSQEVLDSELAVHRVDLPWRPLYLAADEEWRLFDYQAFQRSMEWLLQYTPV